MSFTCSICQGSVEVGQPILADSKMNVAHESCVRKVTPVEPEAPALQTAVSTITLLPLEPAPLPPVCCVCGKPSIALCPYCKRPVHAAYGLSGNCGLTHEATCSEAAKSRFVDGEKQLQAALDGIPNGGGVILTPKGALLLKLTAFHSPTPKNGKAKKRKARR